MTLAMRMAQAPAPAPGGGTGGNTGRARGLRRGLPWLAGVLAVGLAGCAGLPPPPDAVVTGTAFSRLRFQLPPGGTFEAVLLDVSDAEAPPTVVGRQIVDPFERLPVDLRIPYRAAQVRPDRRYVVRAQVSLNGVAWMSSDGVHPLQRDPAYRRVDVSLQPLPHNAATAQAAVPLAQTYWKLVEIDGLAMPPTPAGRTDAHLVLLPEEGRVAGSGGCNRFVGAYEVAGEGLRVGAIESGLQLCLDTGLAEGLFLEALRAAQRYRIEGRELMLFGRGAHDDRALLRFEAPEPHSAAR
ncbi:META domain-containing protein [Acidovorax sp. NCPPB 4044]|uniref:META domain-containing protein n=1 Tax=Acidovorax sp. NCPPB 4044 TaxID=2940490 RepID=UPI002304430B|nr:META domain-containing protein [Acidovorax sp. NCPPB 4044]MDA8523609.1 META domain-containing protein [Acidovorax sp. NCPPB 4044]